MRFFGSLRGDESAPSVTLCKGLEDPGAPLEEAAQVACKEGAFGQGAERSPRRGKAQHVHHVCAAEGIRKIMIVREGAECTTEHFIAKPHGAVESGDSTGEALPDAKVSRLPSDVLADLHQSGDASSDGALTGMPRGCDMRVDTASKVETALPRGGNEGVNLKSNHFDIIVGRGSHVTCRAATIGVYWRRGCS